MSRAGRCVDLVPRSRGGGLSAGIGAQSTGIGPEFQFGHCMGDDFEEPVSVIKTAWGGKTQAGDF